MLDPQHPLPSSDTSPLEEIRRLLEAQNDLLRVIVERLTPANVPGWDMQPESEGDVLVDELLPDYDDDDWDPFEGDDEYLAEPPSWFPSS